MESHRIKPGLLTYVNHGMQEKNHFEVAQVVETFVEVVEALQIHAFTGIGMKDAGCLQGNRAGFILVGNAEKNYCPAGHPLRAAERI